MKNTLVLYHAHCADGFGAAFAAWCALGDTAEYLPVQYDEPFPSIPDGSRVYIVDFSYPFGARAREELCALAERCELTVIDHHQTAQQALTGLPFATFEMAKSGAVLTWEYFAERPELTAEDAAMARGPVPELLLYIQDRDLWRWELPNSREYSAGLALVPREFDRWLGIIAQDGGRRKEIISQGAAVLKRDSGLVECICHKAHERSLNDSGFLWTAMAVNTPVLQSEACHQLLQLYPGAPVAAAYFDKDPHTRVWSLRSRADGPDVSAIAKANGGGGHPRAAGFTEIHGI